MGDSVHSASATHDTASLGASPSPRLTIEWALLFLPCGVKNGAEIGARMAQLLVFDSEDHSVLLSLDNENGFNTLPHASSALVWLSSPPSCSIGSSMPTAAPLPYSAKGSSLPTWPLGASRGAPSAPSCTPLAFSLLFFSPFRMLSPSGSKTKPVFAPPPGGGCIRFY
jgi:hypothetical protein